MARINYENLAERVCCYCKKNYTPTGPAQKSCIQCQKLDANLTRQVSADMDRMKKFGTYDAIGQGNAQGSGSYSPFWKGGKVLSPKVKHRIKDARRFCESCGKDLQDATFHAWCIHHIDEDKTNQCETNLRLLCKRCHQVLHNCVKNLKNEQRLLCTLKRVEVVSSTISADDIV